MPDVSKLPKWAQARIAKLEGMFEQAMAELRKAKEVSRLMKGDERSKVVVNPYDKDVLAFLPDDAIVRFMLNTEDGRRLQWVDVKVCEPTDHGGVGVRVYGDRDFAVEPQSSNVVVIRERREK